MLEGWAGLELTDVGLTKAYPLAEQRLRYTMRAVDSIVVWMGAVGSGHPTHVLSGECFPKLLGLPEVRRHLGRGDELVAGEPLAVGALTSAVVLGEAGTTATVVPPRLLRSHRSLRILAGAKECNGPLMI